MVKISIIIPTYNGKNLLETCLASLQKQTFKNFEVIIIDNGSEDGTEDFINNKYPNFRLIAFKENRGFCQAVNEGITQARAQYAILLNNDVEVEDDWISNLYKCMIIHKEALSCSSLMLDFTERKLIDDAGDYYTILGWAFKGGLGKDRTTYRYQDEIFSSCAGAAIYNINILNRIGQFDEKFFAYLEDVDLSFRGLLYGFKNYFCKDAIVYHLGSATTGGKYNKTKVYLTARNSIYIIYKNIPSLLICLNILFILLGFIVKSIFFFTKGYSWDYLKGVFHGVLNLNQFKNDRKRNMVNRRISCWELEKILIKNTIIYFNYYFSKF